MLHRTQFKLTHAIWTDFDALNWKIDQRIFNLILHLIFLIENETTSTTQIKVHTHDRLISDDIDIITILFMRACAEKKSG